MRLNNDLGTLEDPEVCYILTLVPTATATGGICTNDVGSDTDPCQGNTPTPNPTVTPTPPTLTDFGIEFEGTWSDAEKVEVLMAAIETGTALSSLRASSNLVEAFRTVLQETNSIGAWRSIVFSRATNSGAFCITNPTPNSSTQIASISCDTRVVMNLYTSVHEFGHIFSLRTGNVVMGSVSICNNEWLRGERGWGSGPGSRYSTPPTICAPQGQLFTDFQQNPAPYGTTGQANEETAADMFLNWVYRKLASGGFLNRDWRPHVTATPTGLPCSQTPGGCDDSAAGSGNARFNWMETVMDEIFAARNWNS